MAATFDPYDKKSWYFGPLTRPGAEDLLIKEEIGVFLVRNSLSSAGDLVLCVKEGDRVSHYIIHKIQQGDQTRFRIGDQIFPDVPALLHYYKNTCLDTTSLKRPIERPEQVRAKYDFESTDKDDLPFRRGEILTVVVKQEEEWWTARNDRGQYGSIPVPYVEPYHPEEEKSQNGAHRSVSSSQEAGHQTNNGSTSSTNGPPLPESGEALLAESVPQTVASKDNNNCVDSEFEDNLVMSRDQKRQTVPAIPTQSNSEHKIMPRLSQPSVPQIRLPAKARVIQAKVPNAYDRTALRLQVGDIITVTKTNANGQWEGELDGKTGHFPFNHVKLLDPE